MRKRKRFASPEKAIEYVVHSFSHWPINLSTLKKVPGLYADFLAEGLLNNPETPVDLRQKIQEHLNVQQGFSFRNSDGQTIMFVVAPKGKRFVCWVFNYIHYPMPI